LTMLAVVLFASAERLENAAPLAWRCRGPGKALRIIAAQARMHLAPRTTGGGGQPFFAGLVTTGGPLEDC